MKHDLDIAKQKKLDKTAEIQLKLLNAVDDSIEVAHQAIRGETYRGRHIKKLQLQAALQVIRLAQTIDLSSVQNGIVVNINNVPRPERQAPEIVDIKDQEPIDAESENI